VGSGGFLWFLVVLVGSGGSGGFWWFLAGSGGSNRSFETIRIAALTQN
jgi:hypothetical protein